MTPGRLLGIVAALLAIVGCGSSTDGGVGTTTPARSGDSFPARVAHKFGTTVVPAKPHRIVIVGLTEQDTVLALGYKPIATTEWYGDEPQAVWPWARAALGASKPTVLHNDDGFEFERIAGLEPDLILGVNSGMKRSDYQKLSRLAPTIPAGKGSTDYFSPWDQQVQLIAAALGKPDQGRALVRSIKDSYANAAAANPDFRGKTATFSQNAFYDGLIYVYPAGLNTDFLTMLGFTINPKLTPLAKKRGEQVGISEERIDVLDADVIVFATEKPSDVAALMKIPTIDKLTAVAQRRAVYSDGTLAAAMYFMTPLSLRYVRDQLTPQLKAAVAGNAPQRVVHSSG